MKTNSNRYLVIMAGGVGTRLWPFSRKAFPKQFHDILGTGKTLLQLTAERFRGIIPEENVYIVTNEDYLSMVNEQLPWMKEDRILLEPMGKNTAPCIAYAGYKIAKENPEASMVVAPSDHFIADIDGFRERIVTGLELVEKEPILMTLGIKPSRPDTGYGYIQFLNEKLGDSNKVKTFTEKPQLDLAKKFLESGDFLWNSGIFLWSASTLRAAFEQHEPEIHELFQDGMESYHTENEKNFIQRAYPQAKSISIDYALMEKANNVYTLNSDFGWSDLGTWKSLHETVTKDENENYVEGHALISNTSNCFIKLSDKSKLVVVEGLDGYLVLENDGVLMICRKENEAHIKEVLAKLKEDKHTHLV